MTIRAATPAVWPCNTREHVLRPSLSLIVLLPAVGNGALAAVRWYDGEPVGDGHLQGQFAASKDVVVDMIDKGVFTPSTARQYLKRKLAERVGDRQKLRIPTGESPFEKAIIGQS